MKAGSSFASLRENLQAHASGAAWIASSRTLLIADLHLGYAWAQRRRGELGPVTTGSVERTLFAAVDETKPERIVILGDLVHAPRPSAAEFTHISETLHLLRQRAELTLVAGNHDRGIVRDFGLAPVAHWEEGEFLATHGDRLPAGRHRYHCLYGHWHPTVLRKDAAGANTRYQAFLSSGQATVLPAFSPFSRGLDIRKPWPDDLREALGDGPVRVAVASGRLIGALPQPVRSR